VAGKRVVREGEGMWRGPESGLPRGPHWLSADLNRSVRVGVVKDLTFLGF